MADWLNSIQGTTQPQGTQPQATGSNDWLSSIGTGAGTYKQNLLASDIQPSVAPAPKTNVVQNIFSRENIKRQGKFFATGLAGIAKNAVDLITKFAETNAKFEKEMAQAIPIPALRESELKRISVTERIPPGTRKQSQQLSKWIQETSPENPKFIEKVVQGSGSMAGFALIAVASGGNVIIPSVAEALMESASVYEELRNRGKSIEEASLPADQTLMANIAINTFTNVFGVLSKRTKGLIKVALGAVGEGLQEGAQTFASNIALGQDPITAFNNGVLESMGVGSVLGGVTTVVLPDGQKLVLDENTQQITEPTKPVETKPKEVIKPEIARPSKEAIPTEKSIVHAGKTSFAEVQKRGVIPSETGIFGKGVYFADQGSSSLEEFGEGKLYEVDKSKFNLITLNTKAKETKFIKSKDLTPEIKNLSQALQKSEFDGAVITNPDPNIGNTYLISNTDKLNQVIKGEVVKAKPVVKPKPVKPKVVKVAKEQLPVGKGEVKASRLSQRISETLGKASKEVQDQIPTFSQMSKGSQIKEASKYVTQNPKEALKVLKGEVNPPKGLLYNSIFVAMREQAKLTSDATLITDLASLRSTRFGQEISILTEIDPSDPVGLLTQVRKTRIEAIEKKTGKKVTEAVKQETAKIKKRVKKVSKYDWSTFVNSIEC